MVVLRLRQLAIHVGLTARCFMILALRMTQVLAKTATLTVTAGGLWKSAITSLWLIVK